VGLNSSERSGPARPLDIGRFYLFHGKGFERNSKVLPLIAAGQSCNITIPSRFGQQAANQKIQPPAFSLNGPPFPLITIRESSGMGLMVCDDGRVIEVCQAGTGEDGNWPPPVYFDDEALLSGLTGFIQAGLKGRKSRDRGSRPGYTGRVFSTD
jgi:hypothetical protein